jgi:hypothetical protein
MSKNSKIDERIDNLFVGFDPEESVAKPGRTSGIDVLAPHLVKPVPAQQNFGSSRKILLFPVGIMTICLLTGFFVFARFQTASTAPPPIQQPGPTEPTLPGPTPNTPNTPNPTNVQDILPPNVPGGLTATAAEPATVDLAWAASTDNLGVVGYTIYRNGVSIATASGSDLTFRDEGALPDNTYNYALDAFDQAGNHSAISAPIQVTIPAQPGNQIFLRPSEDTYVNSENPNTVYGTANTLRIDAAPDIHAYLRFIVPGLNGKTIIRARLMLYTESGAVRGIQVRSVVGNVWNELGTNYYNAPSLGDQLASSLPAESGAWITLDVTPYVMGEGRYNFSLVTDSITAIHLASRETGANAPKLSLDLR